MLRTLFKPQHSTAFIVVVAVGITTLQSGSLWTALLIGVVGSLVCGFFESVILELEKPKK